ncbi:PadR family transcriptional regulator [Staphylococcus massiliensis]|uniref:PadR family transcriptional regulator n=1 Tax=Staphylococcus massiliensis S46 TaxID=1229783 RepID=K9AQ64_9STAP|nr:PadR family transcriptional regulator [Staphylococcus massiliensis]EKU48171.1 PadR family transcriptional regulator [Staphylococcus massiliensis S46]MCG3399568.1 PadR family transcriptional regulator [Staphylococcus massiliensis]MCG3402078.1 PadR family transcriptional regulator [Staphylococcus massiliensis]MCG3412971.1 PadR family transcriptional regulator [Staphylococcus massiliensis]POA00985.1 PadR family transcriptional regulator [Staphylococcus massiliensis CCUG 55927]
MRSKLHRKLFLGFIYIHILHHAKEGAIYGSWMKAELEEHGYQMSSGTLYPILHTMEKEGLLKSETRTVNGHNRKYYEITNDGILFLEESKAKLKELIQEV